MKSYSQTKYIVSIHSSSESEPEGTIPKTLQILVQYTIW
jgi:hypothetical protein